MKNLYTTIFISAFLLSSYFTFGQCPGSPPLAFTFESTESRCESNGTITLHITGGAPFTDTNGNPIYNNTIIAPIVTPIGGQADSIFSALAADTYTVEVADANGCTVTQQITVPGNHMQLELTPTWGPATCDGSGGGWICGTPDEGRPWPPGYYEYELLQNGIPIGPIQLDSCFTDLAAGTYQIRAWDSCNNFQTRDVILTAKTYSSVANISEIVRYFPCDTTCVILYASTFPFGEYPYSWEIIASDVPELLGENGTWTTFQQYDTMCYSPMFQSGSYTVEVSDACGTTLTKQFSLRQNRGFSAGGFLCQTQTFYVTASSTLSYCDGSTFEMYSAPSGVPLPPVQDSSFFPVPVGGTYCIRVTDCCGNVTTRCPSASAPTWALRQCNSIPGCTRGWTGFRPCNTNPSAAQGIKYVVTSAPSGYPNTLPDTLGQNGSTLTEGPIGTYCIEAYDACGRTDSGCYTYTDTLVFESNIDIVPGCVTGNEITLTLNTNTSVFSRLFNINGGSVLLGNTTGTTNVLTNFPTGTYYYIYTNTSAGGCELGRDTFTVSDYVPPTISGAWGIECDNGVGLITAQSTGGNLPYTYELFQGPVTRPVQSSPVFPGLPIGVYDIRLFDDCLNSSTTTVSIEPFMPVVKGYGGSFCVGDTAFLYVDYINVATYTWSGPNGNSSDTSILVIPNLTLADAGTYTIDIDVANPDQTACVAQTLTLDLEVFDCVCSPGDFTVNNVDCFDSNNGSVTATMISNAGAPFTYQWNSSQGGPFGNTQTINNLPPGTYAVTIIDAGGCEVTADTTIVGPTKVNVTASIDNVSCASTSDGQVSVTATGGVPNYTYQWGSGQNTPSLTGLSSGTYSISVTDANGCCSAFSLMVGMENCSPCELAENGILDICTVIAANPNQELATLDCDNGGIDNQTECDNGGDPLNPADDCMVATTANTDICTLIGGSPDHPLADQDCDDGGVNNLDECNNGGNPLEPSDDCAIAINGGLDICLLIGADANHPLSMQDCDDGGVDNYTECMNGGDPTDSADDCETAIVAELDLCAIINGNIAHPWATLDCDNGGINNFTECDGGMNPSDPVDDLPCAPCDVAEYNGVDICELIGLEPNHPLATEDCDNGGIDNQTECSNGGDPNDPMDECDMAIATNTNICQLIFTNPNIGLATMDCDSGGVSNEDECNTGEDPNDATDDCIAAIDGNLNICQLINYDPNHPLANLDCDNGGIDNWTECQSGGDPSEPSDDCTVVVNEQIDICVLISNNPTNPISNSDCDGDGVTNETECTDMTDPLDPCKFVDGSITLPVTADQSDCENLCPDLTPITTILPGNIAGATAVGVAVEITELNGIDTDGSGILVRMPSDPRLQFVWDPGLTSVALTTVNNASWNYLGDNGVVHTFQYTGAGTIIAGGTTQAFGFESIYDPQSTDGQTTITASIVPFGGGECNILNDTDSERLVYFE